MELKESIRLRKVVKWKYKVAKKCHLKDYFFCLSPLKHPENATGTISTTTNNLISCSHYEYMSWLPCLASARQSYPPSKHAAVRRAHERSCWRETNLTMWWFDCDCGHWKRKEKEHDAFPFSAFTYFLLSSAGSLTSFCILHRRQINSFKKQLTGWKPVTVIICQRGGELACQTWIVRIKCFFW